MNRPTVAQMQDWAALAPLCFEEPELQWLEELNPESLPYYRWLYRATAWLQPRLALELGVCRAQASAHIAANAGVTVGVDRQPWEPEFSRNVAAMRKHDLDYRFVLGETTEPKVRKQVADLVRRYGPIELLFIDSTHLYHQAMAEWEAYRGMMVEGTMVVMDDILDPPDEVHRAFQEIPGKHVEMHELHIVRRGPVGFGAIIFGASGGRG